MQKRQQRAKHTAAETIKGCAKQNSHEKWKIKANKPVNAERNINAAQTK